MFLEGDRLLDYTGWTRRDHRKMRRTLRLFVQRSVFIRLGPYGSRVGRMYILIDLIAECIIRWSNRDVAVHVLLDVLEKVRNDKRDLDGLEWNSEQP